MKTIYKYPILSNFARINMPKNACILSVINQDRIVTVYALVDTDAETEELEFYLFGTGWDITADDLDELNFVGTFKVDHLVWHVFYKR